jgi:hypothetical protein
MYMGLLTQLIVPTDNGERPKRLNLMDLIWPIDTVLGPVIDGTFGSSNSTWRWAFSLNLLVSAAVSRAIRLDCILGVLMFLSKGCHQVDEVAEAIGFEFILETIERDRESSTSHVVRPAYHHHIRIEGGAGPYVEASESLVVRNI